jgi:hypothetical protein
LTFFLRHFFCPRLPAFRPAKLAERHGSRIPAILHAVLDLAGGNVANELGKLDRVAWSLFAGFGHDDIIAWLATEGIGPSTASHFKLTHYRPPPPVSAGE